MGKKSEEKVLDSAVRISKKSGGKSTQKVIGLDAEMEDCVLAISKQPEKSRK